MFRNSRQGYGLISILLHWSMAIAVLGLFGLGLYMVELTYYDPLYRTLPSLHKSIGLTVAALWVVRLVWRMIDPPPAPLGTVAWQNRLAHVVHGLLYLLMLGLFVSGYLISTADGRPIVVFGLFEVGASLTLPRQEDVAGAVHAILAWTLIGLTGLHALAAVKHHVIDRDATLRRMLRPVTRATCDSLNSNNTTTNHERNMS